MIDIWWIYGEYVMNIWWIYDVYMVDIQRILYGCPINGTSYGSSKYPIIGSTADPTTDPPSYPSCGSISEPITKEIRGSS